MSAKFKSRISTSEFVAAIEASLKSLVERGFPISQASVIANARTSKGNAVGKTTLYKKNDRTGELIHQALIDKIESEKNNRKKKIGRQTRGETIVSLHKEISRLKKEQKGLLNRVVEQEAEITLLQEGRGRSSSRIDSFEGELYVAHGLLLKRHPMLKDLKELVLAFEAKHKGTAHLEHFKKRIDTLEAEIQYSTVFDAKFSK
jgi:chromosome segregation ATPase